MATAKSSLNGLVWMLTFCVIATEAFLFNQPVKKENCYAPPTGLWGIELYEPPSDPTVVVYGYLLLASGFRNTYNGTAELFPLDGSWSLKMNLVGMFEADSCFLYGVLVSHELGVADEFRWIYNGNTMDGIFAANINGEAVYNDYAKHSLTFLDSTDAQDLDEALDVFFRQVHET